MQVYIQFCSKNCFKRQVVIPYNITNLIIQIPFPANTKILISHPQYFGRVLIFRAHNPTTHKAKLLKGPHLSAGLAV